MDRKAILAELKLIPAPIRHLGTGKTKAILQGMKEELRRSADIILGESVERILVEDNKVVGVESQRPPNKGGLT